MMVCLGCGELMVLLTKTETEIFYAYKYFLDAAVPASLEGFIIGVAS